MELGDLPSVKMAFPDEAHEALRRYVDATTVGVDDLAIAMQALAQLANTFFAALDASIADRASIRDLIASEVTRATEAEAALATRLTALESRVTALETQRLRATSATGSATSLVGGATTQTINLKSAMPDANWIPTVWIDATTGVNLSTVTATVIGKTATTATVRLNNSGLALLQTINYTVLALALN